nr:hypothetical protein Iba_chr11cCG2090 [Ipomoea batatas]
MPINNQEPWEVKLNKHNRLSAVQNEASLVGMICMKVAKEISGTYDAIDASNPSISSIITLNLVTIFSVFSPLNMQYMTCTRGLMNRTEMSRGMSDALPPSRTHGCAANFGLDRLNNPEAGIKRKKELFQK